MEQDREQFGEEAEELEDLNVLPQEADLVVGLGGPPRSINSL